LRSFLDDYEIATKGAGWTSKQKCDYLHTYCNRETRELVKRIEARKSGDWSATVRALRDLYSTEDQADRYSRDSLDRFVRKERTISSKKQFIEYYRGFCRRVQGLKETITQEDVNRLFWKGLPRNIQQDSYYELRAQHLVIDRYTAPEIKVVRGIIMSILDKDSLFANLTNSRKGNRDQDAIKGKKHRKERFYRYSDDEDTGSDESDPSDSESSSGGSDSNSSSEEDESPRYHKRKAFRRRSVSRSRTEKDVKGKNKEVRRKESRTNIKRASREGIDLGYAKDNVTDISDQLKKLALMFEQSPRGRPEQEDFLRNMDLEAEPSNKRVLNLMKQIAVQLQEQRQEAQNSMDQPRTPNTYRPRPMPIRCFFCHKVDTHMRGTIHCPEALEMVRKGHCIIKDNRVYMPDGTDLPRIRPNESMSAVIQSLNAARTQRRSPHPNRASAQSPQVSFASIIEADDTSDEYNCDDEMELLEAHPSLWHIYAADRSEKPNERFDPIHKEKRVQWKENRQGKNSMPPRARPYIEVPPVPKQWGNTSRRPMQPKETNSIPSREQTPKMPETKTELKTPGIPSPRARNVQEPNEHGQKENTPGILKKPSDTRKPDFVMRNDPRTPNPGPEKILPRSPPKARFTTTMREHFKTANIYQKVLGTNVTLPLGELLAACPDIEKTMSTETKLRTVPITHTMSRDREEDVDMAEAFANACAYGFDDQCETGSEENDELDIELNERSEAFPFVNVHFAEDENEHYKKKTKAISSTGTFTVTIGHVEGIIAMVDSGAEMNMVTPRLAEELRNRYAEDDRGKRLRLKNVSGEINDLKGCFKDIPLKVGGAKINETFFEGQDWGSNFDIILGQTFLKNNACKVSWNEGHMIMKIYPSGLQEGDSITVRLTEANPRKHKKSNATVNVAEVCHNSDWDSDSEDLSELSYDTISLSDVDMFRHKDDHDIADDIESSFKKLRIHEKDESKTGSSEWEEIEQDVDQDIEKTDEETQEDEGYRSDDDNRVAHYRLVSKIAQHASKLNHHIAQAINGIGLQGEPSNHRADTSGATRDHGTVIHTARDSAPARNDNRSETGRDHVLKIKGHEVRANLNTKVNYNLITDTTRKKLGLTRHDVTEAKRGSAPYEGVHCVYIPMEQRGHPSSRRLFLIVDHIPGDYEILMGKPWTHDTADLGERIREMKAKYERKYVPSQRSVSSGNEKADETPRKLRRTMRKRTLRIKEWYPGELDGYREGIKPTGEDDAMDVDDPDEILPRVDSVSSNQPNDDASPPELGGSFAKTL
jgi:hypothetical protein